MYKRVVLKLSGEALAAGQGFGVDSQSPRNSRRNRGSSRMGVEVAIVVGGGNFFRGVAAQAKAMDRVSADNMGMLGTVINAIAIQDAVEKRDVFCRVMSAIEMNQVLSRTFGGGRSGIWKKGGWSFSPREPEILTFRPTRLHRSGRWKSRQMCYLRRQR